MICLSAAMATNSHPSPGGSDGSSGVPEISPSNHEAPLPQVVAYSNMESPRAHLWESTFRRLDLHDARPCRARTEVPPGGCDCDPSTQPRKGCRLRRCT